MPPSVIGPYRIVRLLGQGGMGAVYEAMHQTIERRVALKVLLPEYAHQLEAVTRLFNEARAVNRIEHPCLVQVSDFGHAEDGTPYLVMEYLRGETLTECFDRLSQAGQRLPLVEALQIAAQVADALSAAHDKGIVHRDLKPGNIMLVPDSLVPGGERARILDFGIAKLTQGRGNGTNANLVMGTPQYMSPEQCRGAGEVDDKTDVYALGVMLYELLAGRLPFVGDGHGEFIGQHMFKEPPPLKQLAPTTPADVATLVHRLLIKDSSQRPAMREVGVELTTLIAGMSSSTGPRAARRPTEKTSPLAPRQSSQGTFPSTIEESPGQTLWSGGNKALRARIVVAVLAVAAAACIALYGFGKQPLRPSSPSPAANFPSQVADTPEHTTRGSSHVSAASKPESRPLPAPRIPSPIVNKPSSKPPRPAPTAPSARRPVNPALSNRSTTAPPTNRAPLPRSKPASNRKAKLEYED